MSSVYDDEDDVAQRKRIENRRARELEDIRFLMSSVQGRRTIWRFLTRCGSFQEAAVFGQADATFYKLGEQAIGRWLISEIDQGAPEFHQTMKLENIDD